jgi:bis(5'-nucleosyl)-tetraphosphatase (symmetrical)
MDKQARQRVFIGDLQGCADELEDLLEAFGHDPAGHELWFVGDLVNRGPASARALRRVIELDANSVLGNHDLHLLAVAAGQRKTGARDTFQDVLAAPDRDELLAWLRARPLVREWDDICLVHGGLHPDWGDARAVAAPLEQALQRGELPLNDPALRFLTRVRYCDASGNQPGKGVAPEPGFAPWNEHYRGQRMVVCGHWAARGLLSDERLRALDSGCVWGGRLTAWLADEDRLVSVPARRKYQQPDSDS